MNAIEKILNKNYTCKICGKEIDVNNYEEMQQWLETGLCDSEINDIERSYYL